MKIEFLAFKSIELARQYAIKSYPETAKDLDVNKAVGLFQPVVSPQDKNLIGVIITGGEWVKDFVVIHESAHAVFHWFERGRKKLDEESYCTLLGKLSAAIIRFVFEYDSEIIPTNPSGKDT